MAELIIFYILGTLINSWFICTWFFTSLPLHLFKIFIPKSLEVESWEDWNNWLMCENKFIAELLGCPLCLGFWSSLFIATGLMWATGLEPAFVFASWFSWPLISFIFYHHLEK